MAASDQREHLEAKLKHLEFIQAAISRMSTSSFVFKGWAVTIAAGLGAFAAVDTKGGVLSIAVVTTVLFWALDGYYLWLERGFVKLHREVAAKGGNNIDFNMNIDKSRAVRRWLRTCFRPHLCGFYGLIIVVDIIGIFMIKGT